MIPVLGVPILNRPELLQRMLSTIDAPVDRLVIVNNGVADQSLQQAINSSGVQTHARQIDIFSMARNQGVAPSWNLLLTSYPTVPYWLICGFDIQFGPGDLRSIAAYVEEHSREIGCFYAHANNAFVLARQLVNRVGLFDENIYPAYLEDCDYNYRIDLAGERRANIPNLQVTHGERHGGSETVNATHEIRVESSRTHAGNFDYYQSKWGGINGCEVFRHPFNNPHLDLSDWRFDLERRSKQQWQL